MWTAVTPFNETHRLGLNVSTLKCVLELNNHNYYSFKILNKSNICCPLRTLVTMCVC